MQYAPMARTKSSNAWLQRHVKDGYVRKAKEQGYRARSAFKLLEIDARDRLLRPGGKVIDLGAAPGGWSQVAAAKVGNTGRVVAVDLLEIAPITGVTVLRGDFREPEVRRAVRAALGGSADVVLSDLSPNISGIASADQANAARLAVLATEFSREVLKPGGAFLVKVFQGEAFEEVLAALRGAFGAVATRKPKASRDDSRETYLLARAPRSRESD
jgi:23S rRNA (uridine2552-2'-O)-methyltransferase